MDTSTERSSVLRVRKCVVCGEPFGLFRAITHGDDCGQTVREFVYSTRALPLVDHVHDDSYQDHSAFAPADSRLQVSGPADQEGVRSGFPSVEEMLADLQRVSETRPPLKAFVLDIKCLGEHITRLERKLADGPLSGPDSK